VTCMKSTGSCVVASFPGTFDLAYVDRINHGGILRAGDIAEDRRRNGVHRPDCGLCVATARNCASASRI